MVLSDVRENEERTPKDGLVEKGPGDTSFFIRKAGLHLRGPTEKIFNRQDDESHSRWAGRRMRFGRELEP